MGYCKRGDSKIVSSNACLYISTFNDWVEAYNEKLLNYRIPVYILLCLSAFLELSIY